LIVTLGIIIARSIIVHRDRVQPLGHAAYIVCAAFIVHDRIGLHRRRMVPQRVVDRALRRLDVPAHAGIVARQGEHAEADAVRHLPGLC
jgi:hypothetical protein